MKEKILSEILNSFVKSSDFNGLHLHSIQDKYDLALPEFQNILTKLIQEEKITLVFASVSINPYIKRVQDLSIKEQIDRLHEEGPNSICAYPTLGLLQENIDFSSYKSRPFTKRLVLAEPQLLPVFFNLDVLERYYRDPRYSFEFIDFSGSIGISSDHYESEEIADRDKVFLQSFGIGYDSDKNRVVVVYLRYLSGLSPEHQQFWSTYISQKNCVVNGDYARASIYGHWSEYFSAYLAFLTEQEEINKLSVFINKPNLFRKTFVNKRPDGFIPMLRPTRKNFNEFILLLDKMLSENINHDFFKGVISLERHVKHENGLVEIQRINTLNLLENWLRENYRTADGEDVSKEVVGVLKQVRKLRQEPAHRLQEDEFDYSYPKNQDEILGKVCRALTKLRYVLWSHPLARDRYTPPEWLDGDMIVFY